MTVAARMSIVTLGVSDLERSKAFYESLGFRRDGGEQRRESFGAPLEVRLRRSLD